MTINIPDGLWDKYNEAADFFIDNDYIGRLCTIIYPPKRTSCVNCIKPVGASTTNVYRHGGPMPFSFGGCPMCGDDGYKEVEYTDTIRLRIYWNRKDWIRIVGNIGVADADAMVIGYMADLPKFSQAVELLLASRQNEAEYRVVVAGKPSPWGFGRSRYFVAFVKGV